MAKLVVDHIRVVAEIEAIIADSKAEVAGAIIVEVANGQVNGGGVIVINGLVPAQFSIIVLVDVDLACT